jgi:hypothetical protein
MPANFGVTSTFGLSASSGGVVEESSSEDEVEAKTIRDETGTTCRAIPSRMVKTTVSIKGRGRSDVSVAAGGWFPLVSSVQNSSFWMLPTF